MEHKRRLIQKVKIETVQAKVLLELKPCPECGGEMNFYLDCPFGDGNIVNPEICSERCTVSCEALIYCEQCDYEEFVEIFPLSGLPIKERLSKSEFQEKPKWE